MVQPYGGNRSRLRLPDAGELLGIVILAVMGAWGVWFAWQSAISLWFPLNVGYAAAGAIVALICAAVGRAMLNR